MALVNVHDLEARWRPLEENERTRATVLMQDAEALIASHGVEVEKLNLNVLVAVVCAMVKRAMAAPIDQVPLKNTQQTAGSFSESITFLNPTGDLYLTAGEKRMLGIGRSRLAILRPYIGASREDDCL